MKKVGSAAASGDLWDPLTDGLRQEPYVVSERFELSETEECIESAEWVVGDEHHRPGARNHGLEASAAHFASNLKRAQYVAGPLPPHSRARLRAHEAFAFAQARQAAREDE